MNTRVHFDGGARGITIAVWCSGSVNVLQLLCWTGNQVILLVCRLRRCCWTSIFARSAVCWTSARSTFFSCLCDGAVIAGGCVLACGGAEVLHFNAIYILCIVNRGGGGSSGSDGGNNGGSSRGGGYLAVSAAPTSSTLAFTASGASSGSATIATRLAV